VRVAVDGRPCVRATFFFSFGLFSFPPVALIPFPSLSHSLSSSSSSSSSSSFFSRFFLSLHFTLLSLHFQTHHTHIAMSSMLRKAAVVSIPSIRQALTRSNPILATSLLAKRSYNSKNGVEVGRYSLLLFSSPALKILLKYVVCRQYEIRNKNTKISLTSTSAHKDGPQRITRPGWRIARHIYIQTKLDRRR